ncbi:RSC9 [Candida jiufengensis]|uniref:RSC9 n=1 Tax=Candida jiufengensis TaxID=497108 RepID=UPI0022252180|nr:RSC9 [Candida jiufengensis]KAI5953417.1 RSC9 [Candida jiufengensis]
MPSLIPITLSSRTTIPLSGALSTIQNGIGQYQSIGTGFYNSYNQQQQPIGTGNFGIDMKNRVVLSLQSGIQDEVNWSLNQLAKYTYSTLVFENDNYIAMELVKYLTKLFQLIRDKKYELINEDVIRHSLDALVTLRNSSQELSNQQFLSQIPNFKKQLVEILKFLFNWNFVAGFKNSQLLKYDDQFSESLMYLLDLIEPLSCYYINNSKNDPLFHTLFQILTVTNDKYIFITTLKGISHLLITWDKSQQKDEEEEEPQEEEEQVKNNCIDSITEEQLQTIVNVLLVADNELNYAVLYFLKMYLFSKALYLDHSVTESQQFRLQKLIKSGLDVLVKQLPLLVVADLPLSDSTPKNIPATTLARRTKQSGAPLTAPELGEDLYKILLTFPEPARASTWLHCCYAPSTTEEVEVTQISIWKAYETQFQEVWKSENPSTLLHPLLPAVEFIKNVTKAFPRAEAKVLSVSNEEQEPKKKFIIKGIKPRQFPVSIEVGGYEALKPFKVTEEPTSNSDLPIGHVDINSFTQSLASDYINPDQVVLLKTYKLNPINTLSHKFLGYIVSEILNKEKPDSDHYASNLFRLHNSYWLPDLIYTNPGLLQTGIIEPNWLKYCID